MKEVKECWYMAKTYPTNLIPSSKDIPRQKIITEHNPSHILQRHISQLQGIKFCRINPWHCSPRNDIYHTMYRIYHPPSIVPCISSSSTCSLSIYTLNCKGKKKTYQPLSHHLLYHLHHLRGRDNREDNNHSGPGTIISV